MPGQPHLHRFLLTAALALPAGLGSRAAAAEPLRIDVETTVEAPIEAVWHAWTTDDGARRFFSDRTNIDLRTGGPFEILFDPTAPVGKQGAEGCTVLAFLPPRLLAFTWNAPPKFARARDQHTTVVVRLEETPAGGTRVALSHFGFEAMIRRAPDEREEWEGVCAYFRAAWPRVLASLARADLPPAPPAPRPRALRHETEVAAGIDATWHLLTTVEGLKTWAVADADLRGDLDIGHGAELLTTHDAQATLNGPATIRNEILVSDAPRLLALRCTALPEGMPGAEIILPTWSIYELEVLGAGRTRILHTSLGWPDDPEHEQTIAMFDHAHGDMLEALAQAAAARVSSATALLERLAGAAWIHEGMAPDGSRFRVRSVVEHGPAAGTFVVNGWAGSPDDLHYHAHTMLWREPGGDAVRFRALDESGGVSHGTVNREADTLVWDWYAQPAEGGAVVRYRIEQVFEGMHAYEMVLRQHTEQGVIERMRLPFSRE